MAELLAELARRLVDDPDAVHVTLPRAEPDAVEYVENQPIAVLWSPDGLDTARRRDRRERADDGRRSSHRRSERSHKLLLLNA